MSILFSDEHIKKVIALKSQMKIKGYKSGWLYHQCKSSPQLLAALNSLNLSGNSSEQKMTIKQPLLVDLVPSSVFYSNIRSLFSEADWKIIQKNTFAKAGHKCEICDCVGNKHAVECHEIWEYVEEEATQYLKGTIALCPMCHSAKHIGLAGIKGKALDAKKRIMQVNGWSMSDVELYLEHCWEQWSRRSNISWNLDIQKIIDDYPEFDGKYRSYYKSTERI